MSTPPPLADALAVRADGEALLADVPEGYDVFGIPHGGFLAALGANAILARAGQPDLFTLTSYFTKKAAVGPMRFEVEATGGSRRFHAFRATGFQEGRAILLQTALVGDRAAFDGPSWRAEPAWDPSRAELTSPAGSPDAELKSPAVAERLRLRVERRSVGFARGETSDEATLRATVEAEPTDQLLAIIACDVTPPAVWNALGLTGWVPTVELTAHVRGRPGPGPLGIEVLTRHVGGGFLEEDAVVHDASGQLVVQSRQLARYSE